MQEPSDRQNPFKGRDILSTADFTLSDLSFLMEYTRDIEKFVSEKRRIDLLQNYILATIFFEPSTRTRLSFESAMIRLGGHVLTVEQAAQSSAKKGETLEDMARVVSPYADVVVMRHPQPLSVTRFSTAAKIPVINGGDGPNEHPTQALLDLYTIYKEKGLNPRSLTIGLIGDLKHGRTVHSLVNLLKHYQFNFVFISVPEIKMPETIVEDLNSAGCHIREVESLSEVISELDVLYTTRIQEERFKDEASYLKVRGTYQLNKRTLQGSKDDVIILHPLPRVDEIDTEVDTDPRGCYFRQAENGLYIRMAILSLVLNQKILKRSNKEIHDHYEK